MDGILQLLRWRLIGTDRALRISLQIDVHFALRYYVARLRIIFKIAAIDLVEAVGFASVDDNVYVLEFGFAGFTFVADFACRMDGEDGSSTLGVRIGKTLGALLHLNRKLLRQLTHRLPNPVSPIGKESGYKQQHAGCDDHQPI